MPHTPPNSSRHPNLLTRAAILGCTLAAFCLLRQFTPPLCALLNKPAWITVELLRALLLLADCRPVSTFLSSPSTFLQYLLQLSSFMTLLLPL